MYMYITYIIYIIYHKKKLSHFGEVCYEAREKNVAKKNHFVFGVSKAERGVADKKLICFYGRGLNLSTKFEILGEIERIKVICKRAGAHTEQQSAA